MGFEPNYVSHGTDIAGDGYSQGGHYLPGTRGWYIWLDHSQYTSERVFLANHASFLRAYIRGVSDSKS
jgi:hypothetical protein